MKCPFCQSDDNGVIDSRDTDDCHAIRRRRSCNVCSRRFTTYERIEEMPIWVIKRDNRRQVFDRSKLISGLMRACEKRPIPLTGLEEIANKIARDAQELGEREVGAKWLGEQVMQALRELDDIAYVRFASVYRSFRDADEFATELNKLKNKAKKIKL